MRSIINRQQIEEAISTKTEYTNRNLELKRDDNVPWPDEAETGRQQAQQGL